MQTWSSALRVHSLELKIAADGGRILQVDMKSLRAILGQVPQDMVLFNDTIFYNILYGRLDATHEEVYEV